MLGMERGEAVRGVQGKNRAWSLPTVEISFAEKL